LRTKEEDIREYMFVKEVGEESRQARTLEQQGYLMDSEAGKKDTKRKALAKKWKRKRKFEKKKGAKMPEIGENMGKKEKT
jgi:hypothetical protein